MIIMSKLNGIDALAELLKCYGSNMGDDKIIVAVQTNLIKTITLCSRND